MKSRIITISDGPSPLILLGAGGHAREILDILEALRGRDEARHTVSLFAERGRSSPRELGLVRARGYALVEGLSALAGHDYVGAVGDPILRQRLARIAEDCGLRAVSAISPEASVVDGDVSRSQGLIVFPGSYVSSNVGVGRHCHLNQACRISHDVLIGDYVTVGPGCLITGNVQIGSSVSIGAGAVLLPGISIGDRVVVGAGAVVTRDVPSGMTVVGNPARPIRRLSLE